MSNDIRSIRWNEVQWRTVEQQAEAAGMSCPDYVRRRALAPALPCGVEGRLQEIANGIGQSLEFVIERALTAWLARDLATGIEGQPRIYAEFCEEIDGNVLEHLTARELEARRKQRAYMRVVRGEVEPVEVDEQ